MAADSADDPAPAPTTASPRSSQQQALIDQLGGVRGMIDGAIPALVFVTINVVAGL
jgi:hypothetical protein